MGGLRVEGRFLHAILYTIFRLPGIAQLHRRFASNGPDVWVCFLAVFNGRDFWPCYSGLAQLLRNRLVG